MKRGEGRLLKWGIFSGAYGIPLIQTTQAFTDVITDGVVRRWWKGFDVIRRLMYIVIGTVFDMAFPEYTQVQ